MTKTVSSTAAFDLRTFPEAGAVMDGATFDDYLRPAALIDSGHPAIRAFADSIAGGLTDPVEKAVRLYYAVRDQVRYDPYGTPLVREAYVASTCLAQRHGYCVNKSGLMAALARCVGIPARVGYADVRNHMTTKKLSERMGTDVFYFHGYTDLFLDGRWIKATPVFNIELTDKFRLKPLEFNGRDDSIYGGLNSFFLLMDKPEVYGLPNKENAVLPSRNNFKSYLAAFVAAAIGVFAGVKALGGSAPSESTGGAS